MSRRRPALAPEAARWAGILQRCDDLDLLIDGTAEAVADLARAADLDDDGVAALVAAAGLCNECGDPAHKAGETCPAVTS
jgi:hypothetical protein